MAIKCILCKPMYYINLFANSHTYQLKFEYDYHLWLSFSAMNCCSYCYSGCQTVYRRRRGGYCRKKATRRKSYNAAVKPLSVICHVLFVLPHQNHPFFEMPLIFIMAGQIVSVLTRSTNNCAPKSLHKTNGWIREVPLSFRKAWLVIYFFSFRFTHNVNSIAEQTKAL